MSVKEIVIDSGGIDVISISSNGIKNIQQINLESQDNEISSIYDKYNLNLIINYVVDPKIVRALADNKEQLIDYLDTCREADNSRQKVEVPDDIPQITYNFTDIKDGFFKDIDDKQLRRSKQLDIYKLAKKMQDFFRRKVDIIMKWMDKAYYTIQDFLQREQKPVLALNPGTENRRNKWEVGENIKEAINEVSRQHSVEEKTNEQVSRNDEERSVE